MAFSVEIEPQAFDDIDELASAIRRGSSFETARRWFNGLMAAIASLSEMPKRPAARPAESQLQDLFQGPA